MQIVNPAFNFLKISDSHQDFHASITLLNQIHQLSVKWGETRDSPGGFSFSLGDLSKDGEHGLPEAGIARILKFVNALNDKYLDQFKFKKKTAEDFPDKTENEIAEINASIPSSGAGKFYILEKMLKELSVDDIFSIGQGRIIPVKVNYIHPVPPKRKFDCQVEYLNIEKANVHFKSLEEEGGLKSIAVFYQLGADYENYQQRIIKTDVKQYDMGNTVSYCSDWSIQTTGKPEKSIIHDLAYRVAKNLSLFLGMSEQYIRAARFNELWDMCRGSS